jgi:hypothetical protein
MIDRMLSSIAESKEKVEEIEAAARLAKKALSVAEMSSSAILFELAEQANELEGVNAGRRRVSKAGFVTILDQREIQWNGDLDEVKSEWNGDSFDVNDNEPDLWFWSGDMVICFFSDNICWVIFDKRNIIEDKKEKVINTGYENGTEETKRNLH